jgi:uncharacterized protein YndB with AHSA1/START domain/DNA-binding transcriptional ArsR family regulator
MVAFLDLEEGDEVFRALADRSRRRLLDGLNVRNGQSLRELCGGLSMTRQSVSKHLAVLEAAGLVTSLRRGREKLHYLNAAPINDIADRWMSHYDRKRAQVLADLKRALEDLRMDAADTNGAAGGNGVADGMGTATAPAATRPSFVYRTYIRTTPERLWQMLTDPVFTGQWWSTSFETDWNVGSPMVWHNHGVTITDPEQVVLEYDPPRRLSYTWHTFTPEVAKRFDFSDELMAKLTSERRSRVTFEIEPLGDNVKLTVVHDDFDPGSTGVEMVSEGWPQLLSGLKSFLETGELLSV